MAVRVVFVSFLTVLIVLGSISSMSGLPAGRVPPAAVGGLSCTLRSISRSASDGSAYVSSTCRTSRFWMLCGISRSINFLFFNMRKLVSSNTIECLPSIPSNSTLIKNSRINPPGSIRLKNASLIAISHTTQAWLLLSTISRGMVMLIGIR
uniref:Putative secreted protein n=1 Tax=Anopheles darlingi TaxID=43151 RepID=A0A2M4D7B2_ANODA